MSKRFTETLKWQDPWFRRLTAPAKMLWFYATDHCDNIGVVEIDLDFVSKDCGLKITETHLLELGKRLEPIGDGKFFIPKFIPFQYGRLSSSCPAHKKVIEAVESHCIMQDSLGYHYPSVRVTDRVTTTLQEEDKDRKRIGKEEGSGEKPPQPPNKARCTELEAVEFVTSLQLPRSDGEWFFQKCEGNGWKNGGEPIKDWRATVKAWKTAGYMASQKGSAPNGAPKVKKLISCL